MAHFMIGYNPSFLLAQHPVLLLLAHQNHFHCLKQILLAHSVPLVLYGKNSRFIDHIRQIRSYRPGGSQGNGIQIHRIVQRYILGMNL